MPTLRADPPRSRRPVGGACTARGRAPQDAPGGSGAPGLRDPGGGPPAGDRAPPRGVDVKPSPGAGSRTPSGGLGGPFGQPGTPGGVLETWRAPGTGDPGSGEPGEGGFTSTPRAGALSPARWSRPLPGSGSPKSPIWGFSPKKAHFGPLQASPGREPQTPEKAGTGPRREGLM